MHSSMVVRADFWRFLFLLFKLIQKHVLHRFKVLLKNIQTLLSRFLAISLQFLKVTPKLLHTNSLMIINSLLMSTIHRPQTLKANPAIQPTPSITADELIALTMFETMIKTHFHFIYLQVNDIIN